jgi:DNA polymerase III subunit delta'
VQRWLMTRAHGLRKVYLLEGVDSMTGVAANRMLKTLEEPGPNVHAILTASRRQSVLSTIRSRSFIYELTRSGEFASSDHEVVSKFEELFGNSENDTFDGFVEKMIRWTEMWLLEKEPVLILAATWQSYCDQVTATDSLMLLAEWLRDILYFRAGASNGRFRSWEHDIQRIAPILEVEQWTRAVQLVLDSRTRLQSHVASLLNFEQMCIRLREVST